MKTLETFKKKVTTSYQTEIIEVDADTLLIVNKTNYKVASQTFVLKKDCKIDKKKQSYDITNIKKDKYSYYDWGYFSPAILDKLKTTHMQDIDTRKFKLDPYKELKAGRKIDVRRVMWFDYSSHLVYKLGQDAPVSQILCLSDIGGVDNLHYDLEKAHDHLKKRKSVLEVKQESHGLAMKVLVPQATMNKVWEVVKTDTYPSVRLKDIFVPRHWHKNNVDPLGIKKFMRTEKEIETLEELREQIQEENDSRYW